MINPITKFHNWQDKALKNSPLNQKIAACLSTINENGFPSGRFVDLKKVDDGGFTFCTSLNSVKAREIEANPKVGMTVWWDHVGYQVRIIGNAATIAEEEATSHWQNRSREAQLTSLSSNQSKKLNQPEDLRERFDELYAKFRGEPIPKPSSWGGFRIQPTSIEFLTFKDNRLHLRELYEMQNGEWQKTLLQP